MVPTTNCLDELYGVLEVVLGLAELLVEGEDLAHALLSAGDLGGTEKRGSGEVGAREGGGARPSCESNLQIVPPTRGCVFQNLEHLEHMVGGLSIPERGGWRWGKRGEGKRKSDGGGKKKRGGT